MSANEYRSVNCLALLLLILVGAAPAVVEIPGLDSGWGLVRVAAPRCYVLESTGQSCKTCGLTRSVGALYRGEWSRSHGFHPAGPVLASMLLLQIAMRLVALVTDTEYMIRVDVIQLVVCVGMFLIIVV